MANGPRTNKGRLQKVLKINLIVFIAEMLSGYESGSLSMISDGLHVSLHVFASLVALASEYAFFEISPKKIKFWSTVTNVALFFPLAYMIASEANIRWQSPPVVHLGPTFFFVATMGLIANLYTVRILEQKQHSHNERSENVWILRIHMIFDSIGSVIVLIGAIGMVKTGNYFIDPISSFILSGLIVLAAVWMSWKIIHEHHH